MSKPIWDLSHHQDQSIDWAKIKNVVAGVIIRVQYGSKTIDKLYKTHAANAKAQGVPFGHYAYGCFTSVNDARVEAMDFLSRMDKAAKFLMLDVEKDTLAACGPTNLVAASQAFIDVCKAAGYKTGLYVSHEMYKKLGLDKVKADFLMLPRYGKDNGQPDLKPDYPCDIWQYSQYCSIPGYPGHVDLSLLNGSKLESYFFGEPAKTVVAKPATKPAQVAPNNDKYMYIVKPGDTLGEIATAHNMSIAELAKLNAIDNPSRIYAGQRLKLKGGATVQPKAVAKPVTPQPVYYTIKSGDALSKIAAKFGTTAAAIDKLNAGITNINKIDAGQKIRVK